MAATPTPVGSNDITAVVDRYLMDELTDVVYPGNLLTFRWNRAKKIIVDGGTTIETPLMYAKMPAGGWFSGYQTLNIVPSDTVRNIAFDWKFAYTPVTIDFTSLVKAGTARALYNIVAQKWKQAEMHLSDILGFGLWGGGGATPDPDAPDGLQAIRDTSNITSYGGVARSTLSALNPVLDTATSAFTLDFMEDFFMSATEGGRHPTIILSRKEQYARFIKKMFTYLNVGRADAGMDVGMADAGYLNAGYNGVPWAIDPHCFDGPSTSNSVIAALNEDYFDLVVSDQGDFLMEPFQRAIDQAAMVGKLFWSGNIVCKAPLRQAFATNISS
jgi:hypothetical protein